MKTNIMLLSVLAVLFVWLFPVSAEEILVGTNGEVVVKSEPWRLATAEEVKAYKTGEEIPVWLSPYRTNVSFFRGGLVRVSTNSLVYRDGRIHPVARSTTKIETTFLWYKVLMVVAIAMMILSNILFKRHNDPLVATFVTLVVVAAVVLTTIPLAITLTHTVAITVLVVTVATFVTTIATIFNERKVYKISSALFYLMAILAMVV